MNFVTQLLHILGSGATAYISARNLRDPLTRPHTLATLQFAEAGAVPFLETLRDSAQTEGDTWLAEQLTRHANDERRHAQIFANGLKHLNKQAIDLSQIPATATNGTPDERRRSPFFAAYFDGYSGPELSAEGIDWTLFMASTYILELDASTDFVRMANVLPETTPRDLNLKKGILSVAQDETRHAAYLREALERRLGDAQAEALIDTWRTRKVNALMAMVSSFIQKGGKLPQMAQDGVPQPETQESERELVGVR
jgi:rubrerythrin